MDSKQAAKLRAWQRRYGAAGTILVGCCLYLEYWRTRRKVKVVSWMLPLALIVGMLAWLHPVRHPAPMAVLAVPVPARSDLNVVLLAATRNNDLAQALACLRQGANVNAANSYGETALALACSACHPDIMIALLEHGANPDISVRNNNADSAPLLIQAIQTFHRWEYGETTCRALVRAMLNRGVNIHVVDTDGDTALLAAIEAQEPEIAQWLIAGGADINRANKRGETPLYVSTYDYKNSDSSVLNTLLQCDVDVRPARNGGWNILCWAAEIDDLRVAQEAIRRGVGVNSRDERNRTPLMYAAARQSPAALSMLLSQGANVNARDNLGWNALMFAAQNPDFAVVNALLEHGADRAAHDRENGWTAEQRARHVGQEQIACLLQTGRIVGAPLPTAIRPNVDRISDRPDSSKCVWIDAHRWIENVHVPSISQECGEGACGVVIVDDEGRRGKPFGGETFFFSPKVQVFPDTDGHLYAFIEGHHRSESNFIVGIQGRSLVKRAETWSRYDATFQPLIGGGALITCFDRPRDMEGVPAAHLQDHAAEVSRFLSGKLTSLGFLFLPEQNL